MQLIICLFGYFYDVFKIGETRVFWYYVGFCNYEHHSYMPVRFVKTKESFWCLVPDYHYDYMMSKRVI